MVRRIVNKRTILFTLEGLVLVTAVLLFVNYRTLFGGAQQQKPAATQAQAEKPAPKPLGPDSLLAYTNAARQKAGLKPLALDGHLNTSAKAKADDMATNAYYDHDNPTTGQQGYTYIYANMPETCKFVGENLYLFETSPTNKTTDYAKQVVDNWVTEAGKDKVAIMDPDYTKVGFGVNDRYVVQHFCQL